MLYGFIPGLGGPEMLVLLVLGILLFGRKLPELGRSLGRSISEFKRATNELHSSLEDEIRAEERRGDPSKAAGQPAPEVSRAEGTTPVTKVSASSLVMTWAPVPADHPPGGWSPGCGRSPTSTALLATRPSSSTSRVRHGRSGRNAP